jgi:hypothetical protein
VDSIVDIVVRRCRLKPVESRVESVWSQPLNLICGDPFSNVAFNFNLRCYMVAVAAGLDYLGADEMTVSPLPMGRGVLRGAAHGPLPSPPPATVSCLCGAGVGACTHPRFSST